MTGFGRVEMWRGGVRLSMSVSAPFVWRCLSGSAVAVPSLRRSYPVSAVLRTSPPPQSARPVPRGRPVGPVIPDLTTLWGFPCCARFPCVRAAATTPVQRLGVVLAPPEAVLWCDPNRDFARLLPALRRKLPNLLTLGEYHPAHRQGPAIWLRAALGRAI